MIAASTVEGSTPVFVALEKGFFRAEGLNASLSILPTGQLALEEMLAGRANFATVGDTPFVRAVVEGKSLRAIATISENNYANAIVARRDRGIAKPEDLRHRRIGRVPWTTADFFLHVYLTTSYVDPDEVQVVDVSATRLVEELVEGRLDAVSTWPPYTAEATRGLGTNAVVLHDPDVYTMSWIVAAPAEWVEAAPETTRKFLRALVRSAQHIRENPGNCREIYARHAKLDLTTMAAVWRGWSFEVSLDQSLILNLEDQARWILSRGTTRPKAPNFIEFVHADGLRAVNPETVRIPGS